MTRRAKHHNGPRADIVLVDDYVHVHDYANPEYLEALRNWYGAVTSNHIDVIDLPVLVTPTPENTTPTRRSTRKWWPSTATHLWAIGGPLALLHGMAEVEQYGLLRWWSTATIETAPELECWAHRDAGR